MTNHDSSKTKRIDEFVQDKPVCVPAVLGAPAVWINKREPPVLSTPPSYLRNKEKSNISIVFLSVYAYDSKTKVHCGSAMGPGASGPLPCYCAPLVCVPTVIGVLTCGGITNQTPKTISETDQTGSSCPSPRFSKKKHISSSLKKKNSLWSFF